METFKTTFWWLTPDIITLLDRSLHSAGLALNDTYLIPKNQLHPHRMKVQHNREDSEGCAVSSEVTSQECSSMF